MSQIELHISEEFLKNLGCIKNNYKQSTPFFRAIENKVFDTSKAEKLHYNWKNEVTVIIDKDPVLNFYTESIDLLEENQIVSSDISDPIMTNIIYGWILSERTQIIDQIKQDLTEEQKQNIEDIVLKTPLIDKDIFIEELFDCFAYGIYNQHVNCTVDYAINRYFVVDKTESMFDHADIGKDNIEYWDDTMRPFNKELSEELATIFYNIRYDSDYSKPLIDSPKFISSDPVVNKKLKEIYDQI